MDYLLDFLKPKKLFPFPLAACFALGSFIKCLKNVLNAGHDSANNIHSHTIYDHNMAMDFSKVSLLTGESLKILDIE